MVEIQLRGTAKTGHGKEIHDALNDLATSLGHRHLDCTPPRWDPSSGGRLGTASLIAPIPGGNGRQTDREILGIIIIDRDA